jgi:hypothetical protein
MRCVGDVKTEMTVNVAISIKDTGNSLELHTKLKVNLATYMGYSNIQYLTTQKRILYYFYEIPDSVSHFFSSANSSYPYLSINVCKIRNSLQKQCEKATNPMYELHDFTTGFMVTLSITPCKCMGEWR